MNLEIKIEGIRVDWLDEDYGSVVAERTFNPGDIIEVAPLVMLSQRDSNLVRKTRLMEECFQVGKNLAVAGGHAPAYSFLDNPNASFEAAPEERVLVIKAIRKIRPEEFIYVDRKEATPDPEYSHREPSPWTSKGLQVRPSPGRGLGVFTTRKFAEGELVELCHLFTLSGSESSLLAGTKLSRYMYACGSKDQLNGWAVGYPCFYNYSKHPNVDPWGEVDQQLDQQLDVNYLAVRALRDLKPGAELVFDYQPSCKKKDLGFKPVS